MAFENLDPYKTLGLGRDASEKDIKSAWRRLARKYHPDVNPNDSVAEERFKEINEANAILSDPERRAQYDRYGSEGVRRSSEGQGPAQGWGFSGSWEPEIFPGARDIFGGIFDGSIWGTQSQTRTASQKRGPSVEPESVRERWERSRPVQPDKEEPTRFWKSGISTKKVRETNISILRQYEALCRAMYLASCGAEDTEFVVVSPFRGSGNHSREEYPLWRIRKEDGNLKIFVSDVIHEGRKPTTSELSSNFRWHDLSTGEGRDWIGREHCDYIELIRELVLNSERFMGEGEKIQRFNELGKIISQETGIPLRMSASIESHLANITRKDRTSEDAYIFRPNERLLMREGDMALLSLLVLSREERLHREQILTIFEERAVRNEFNTITRREKVPIWIIDTAREPSEFLPTQTNSFSGRSRRYYRLYTEEISELANEIVENGALSIERVRRFTETLRLIGVSEEDRVIFMSVRREEAGVCEKVESMYSDFERSHRYDCGIAKVEADSVIARMYGIEGLKRNLVEGNVGRLRFEVPLPLKEKKRRGIGPEGIY